MPAKKSYFGGSANKARVPRPLKNVYSNVKAKGVGDKTVSAQPVAVVKQEYKSTVQRSAYGKGRSIFLKMPFTDTISFDTGAAPSVGANLDRKIYAINSINLPRVVPAQAVGMYLPQNHNSLENVFARYKVTAVKIKAEITDVSGACKMGFLLTGSQDPASFSGTFVSQMEMKIGSAYRNVSKETDKERKFYAYVKIRDLEGLSKPAYEADTNSYTARITSTVATAIAQEDTPTLGRLTMRKPLFHIAIASMDGTQQTAKVKVDIEYYVKAIEKMAIAVTTSG